MTREKKFFLSFAVLTFLIYGQSLVGGFVYDDRGIAEHAALWTGVDKVLQVASYPYWTTDAGLYRPVTLLSYLGNSVFLGHGAFGFHLINLLLYFGICVSIFVLLKKLFKNEWLAYLAALLFLVLPIHTEVVANISGRSELLALFFSLLTLIEAAKAQSKHWLLGLWMLFAIGSKETAIATLPLVFLVILFEKKSFKLLLAPVAGTFIYFIFRFLVLGKAHFLGVETSVIENPLLFTTGTGRVSTALAILWMYVQKTFVPVGLCSDYSFDQIPVLETFFNLKTLLGAGVLLGAGASFLIFLKRPPLVSFASAIFLASFVPVSNLLFPVGTIAGERLFFFPSLGFALLAAYMLTRRETWIYVGLFIALIYGFLAQRRQAVWVSEERLFLNAAQCAPRSVLSLSNAGTVYYFKGNYVTAEKYLEKSRAIKPVYSKGLNNLGLVYWKEGRYREAEAMYLLSLDQKYPYPGAIENLILLYKSENNIEKALPWLRIMYPDVVDSSLRNLF